jgi:hypothetical protein
MDAKELKKQLLEIARSIGEERVCGALISRGLSPSTSERLCFGEHKGNFKRRTAATVRAYIEEQKARAS